MCPVEVVDKCNKIAPALSQQPFVGGWRKTKRRQEAVSILLAGKNYNRWGLQEKCCYLVLSHSGTRHPSLRQNFACCWTMPYVFTHWGQSWFHPLWAFMCMISAFIYQRDYTIMWQLKPQTKTCTYKKKRTKSARTVKCNSDMIVKTYRFAFHIWALSLWTIRSMLDVLWKKHKLQMQKII